ncbi:D-3-phosphoglycerate dehydrogenase [Roseomonas rosea]|uniref:D-3-phosphoglycerate dehydrogenase n=1 Tax=Muricoccus roseus TaxID=198092 RepID=A0A1M6EAR3_9PROT|nr:NAD(P)-dependent oxidoreductase [Roseomonas rosea]SHI82597.1 D-3-phosphoglycerate dehydrogenase [Roseomonas rosea]
MAGRAWQAGERRMRIFLTHTPEARANYYPDAALEALRGHGTVLLNPEGSPLPAARLAEMARGCEVIVADRMAAGDAGLFGMLPDCVAFLRVAVDIRNIDVAAASRHGVLVGRATPGFVDSVAELAVGMMVELARGLGAASAAYRAGEAPPVRPGRQLAGAALGIIGYGAIGRRVAALGLALGMRVLVTDPGQRVEAEGVEQLGFRALLGAADFVICLAPATPETEGLMDAAAFGAMRPGSFFLNLARGELVDEAALERALESGHLAGAAMDVGRAPDQMPSPFLARRADVVATPHVGGLTPEAVAHQAFDTVRQVAALAAGQVPPGAVNAAEATRLGRLGIRVG